MKGVGRSRSKPPRSAAVKYRASVRLFHETFTDQRTANDREWLLQVVLDACHSAERFHAVDGDENNEARKLDLEAAASLHDQIGAIDTLMSFARSFDQKSSYALAASGFSGRGNCDVGKDLSAAFIDMLAGYKQALKIVTKRGGPWQHRYVVANLIFAQPIDDRANKQSVATGLLFQLVLLFRNFSAGISQFARIGSGSCMPDHGRPHYELAAEFAESATGEEIRAPGPRLRKFLRENPGVGYHGWPDK